MRVAVEDAHPVHVALELHPAPGAAVARERGAHPRRREAELDGRGEGSGGVQRIVAARHVHGQLGEDLAGRAGLGGDREGDRRALGFDVGKPVIGAGLSP